MGSAAPERISSLFVYISLASTLCGKGGWGVRELRSGLLCGLCGEVVMRLTYTFGEFWGCFWRCADLSFYLICFQGFAKGRVRKASPIGRGLRLTFNSSPCGDSDRMSGRLPRLEGDCDQSITITSLPNRPRPEGFPDWKGIATKG